MFTGIVESLGKIIEIEPRKGGKSFWIQSPISKDLHIDQSISHDGACLTVEKVSGDTHLITAVPETLAKTTLGSWSKDRMVNLERSLTFNGRLDGHLVQGHVDTTGRCTDRKEVGASWEFQFEFSKHFSPLVIEKGSIALNGISLTIFDVKKKSFRVAIIPYTYEHTTMREVVVDSPVNLEFDFLGKYVRRWHELTNNK